MRLLKSFGVVVVALFVLAVTAGSALALGLPSLLNIKSPQSVTLKGVGVVEFQGLSGVVLKCEEASAEASLSTENAGTFHMALTKCKESSPAVTCTGKDGTATDASGTILFLGTVKIVHDVMATGSTYALLFELNPVAEFECSALAKIKVLGTLLCLIVEPTIEKESHTVNCKNNGTVGDPQEVTYWFEMNEGIAALLIGVNGGKEESAAELASETFVTTGSPKAVVMN